MAHLCSAGCKSSLILLLNCKEKGTISNKYPKAANSKKGNFYHVIAGSNWKIRKNVARLSGTNLIVKKGNQCDNTYHLSYYSPFIS